MVYLYCSENKMYELMELYLVEYTYTETQNIMIIKLYLSLIFKYHLWEYLFHLLK